MYIYRLKAYGLRTVFVLKKFVNVLVAEYIDFKTAFFHFNRPLIVIGKLKEEVGFHERARIRFIQNLGMRCFVSDAPKAGGDEQEEDEIPHETKITDQDLRLVQRAKCYLTYHC